MYDVLLSISPSWQACNNSTLAIFPATHGLQNQSVTRHLEIARGLGFGALHP
jgi:hypothetical protein